MPRIRRRCACVSRVGAASSKTCCRPPRRSAPGSRTRPLKPTRQPREPRSGAGRRRPPVARRRLRSRNCARRWPKHAPPMRRWRPSSKRSARNRPRSRPRRASSRRWTPPPRARCTRRRLPGMRSMPATAQATRATALQQDQDADAALLAARSALAAAREAVATQRRRAQSRSAAVREASSNKLGSKPGWPSWRRSRAGSRRPGRSWRRPDRRLRRRLRPPASN